MKVLSCGSCASNGVFLGCWALPFSVLILHGHGIILKLNKCPISSIHFVNFYLICLVPNNDIYKDIIG